MMCNAILSNLGYQCHALADDFTQITTPFTLHDGSAVTLFIEQYGDDRFLITDDAQTLMNISARGIVLSPKRIQHISRQAQQNGIQLNDRGELAGYATKADLAQQLNRVTQNALIASQLASDWFSPVMPDNFEQSVKASFKQYVFPQQITLAFDSKITGSSGHEIAVPITLTQHAQTKYIFTTSIQSARSWAGAYGILGKMIDLSENSANQHFVVVDNNINPQQFNELTLLFNNQATVLPFKKKEIWLPRLAA